jgi:hypothetical protein
MSDAHLWSWLLGGLFLVILFGLAALCVCSSERTRTVTRTYQQVEEEEEEGTTRPRVVETTTTTLSDITSL